MATLSVTPIVGLLLVAVLAAAEPALSRHAFTEPHMGTRFKVIVYAPDEATAKGAARAAFARVAELDGIMSDYRPTSELMRLCRKAGGAPVPVGADLFAVLSRGQALSRRSEGAFDVTVGPVVRLWRTSRRTQRLPDPDDLARARSLVGYEQVKLDPEKRTVRLAKPGMRLDLGGIAKGYAADAALGVLREHGLSRVLVAAGGDVRVGDPPPAAAGWKVAIAPLEGAGRHLLLTNAAVSTSGDAEQFVEIDGRRYSHIVDPRTGLGLPGRGSVTVVARDGTTADALATAANVLGPEKGVGLVESVAGAAALFVRKTDRGEEAVATRRFQEFARDPPKD